MRMKLKLLTLCLTMTALYASAQFQKDPLERTWLSPDKKMQMQIVQFKQGIFLGKIVWLQQPELKDVNNKEKPMRTMPLMNAIILVDLVKSDDRENVYEHGSLYDPDKGRPFCAEFTLKDKTLEVYSFPCQVGLLGKARTWTLVE